MAKYRNALTFHPLTPDRWADLETLFGVNGACAGCWCMTWRLRRAEFNANKGASNKRKMKALVMADERPGILAYAGREPVGWCAVAPRSEYPVLANSRVMAPLDDQPVWSVTCLFIARGWRRKGVSVKLLKSAAEFVKARGGRIVEGYPSDPGGRKMTDVFVWTGLAGAFEAAGFKECARRSPTRPIMRKRV